MIINQGIIKVGLAGSPNPEPQLDYPPSLLSCGKGGGEGTAGRSRPQQQQAAAAGLNNLLVHDSRDSVNLEILAECHELLRRLERTRRR